MADERLQSDSYRSHSWLRIAAVWFGIGLFDATQTVFVMRGEGMHHRWVPLFFTLLASWLPWALATPLVLRLAHRFPPQQWRRVSTWAAHLAACEAIGLVYSAWVALWERWLNPWAASNGRLGNRMLSRVVHCLRHFLGLQRDRLLQRQFHRRANV